MVLSNVHEMNVIGIGDLFVLNLTASKYRAKINFLQIDVNDFVIINQNIHKCTSQVSTARIGKN